MKVIVQTSFLHGDLLDALQTVGWSETRFARESGLTAVQANEILALVRRPNSDEQEAIFCALAREGVCCDTETFWPKKFRGFGRKRGGVPFGATDEQYLTRYFPKRRIEEIADRQARDQITRIDAKQFLTEFENTLVPSERLLFRDLLEGVTPRERALERVNSQGTLQSLRKKLFLLALTKGVSKSYLRELVMLLADFKYVPREATGEIAGMDAERRLLQWKRKQMKQDPSREAPGHNPVEVWESDSKIRIRFYATIGKTVLDQLQAEHWSYDSTTESWHRAENEDARKSAECFSRTMGMLNFFSRHEQGELF